MGWRSGRSTPSNQCREAEIADLSGAGRDRARHAETRINDLGRERASAPAANLWRVSWGAILAGAILALMIQFMLGLFGLGVGLSSPTGTASGIVSVGGLWAVFVVLVGVFAGAFAAGRFAGVPSRIDGALHGVVTWAVTALLALYLLSSGAASLVGGAFGVLGQSVGEMATAAEALAPGSSSLADSLKGSSEQLFAPAPRPSGGAAEAEAGAATPDQSAPASGSAAPAAPADRDVVYAEVVAALSDGDQQARGAAVDAIAGVAGVARAEAERRFDGFAERFAQARTEMEAARRAAASALARASLAAFVAMLLGMAVGAAGGVLGRPDRVAEPRAPRH
ncbi:hypothetical protein [Jiella pacifica]|uniref:PhnA-like protein n=1 Tax=Jiella pacifica TaxID=2696469 RepID=A0A6N9T7R1_9HYPH|nr:hypothetical protein [Jiella pacifica]NDW06106.1 hypothetical protein [Jiella pacifica]